MSDAVIVEYRDGRRYELESAAVARKAHPDAKIVEFSRTGEPYKEGTKASPPANPPAVVAMGGDLIIPDVAGESMTSATSASAPKEKA